MEQIKRKRVTRVGSGAFSIYLPKKWIDSWAPNVDDERLVDLHVINESLLIVPANRPQQYSEAVGNDVAAVCRTLLSAYLRGADTCHLTPIEGRFSSDVITAARDLLRHVDERLVVTSNGGEASFSLDPTLPPPATDGADILRSMAAKLQEMLGLTAEAVDTWGKDPDRALHALNLLVLTQREDVQRLLYQAVRLVARIELPMESVSDFQFLDLIASDFERMGGHMVRIAETLLITEGMGLADLEFPRAHLLKQLTGRPSSGPAKQMVMGYRQGFSRAGQHFAEVLAALASRDVAALDQFVSEIEATQRDVGDRVFAAIAEHWGEETDEADAAAAFATSKIAIFLADILHAMQSVARHAVLLLSAKATA